MALKIYRPGTRKGNRYCIARGRVAGELYEFVCRDPESGQGLRDETLARIRANAIESAILQGHLAGPSPTALDHPGTFAEAAARYRRVKNLARYDDYLMGRILDHQGIRGEPRASWRFPDLPLAEISLDDIYTLAEDLQPGCKNSTKNRQVIVPVAAVLHYAADNNWCRYMRVKRLKEGKPKPRPVDQSAVNLLLEHTDGYKHGLILALVCQGWRISESLGVTWENIDLPAMEFKFYISKADRWKYITMHPEVFEWLSNLPEEDRQGRLFPWTDRTSVYHWTRQLSKDLKITFTPHMARHRFVTELKRARYSDKQIESIGTWTDHNTISRYEDVSGEDKKRIIKDVSGRKKA